MEDEYIRSLTPRELVAHDIAKNHLGMSFCLAKSNGYLAWLRKEEDTHKRKCVVDVPFNTNKKISK
jgi:hypothetical protein